MIVCLPLAVAMTVVAMLVMGVFAVLDGAGEGIRSVLLMHRMLRAVHE